MSGSLCRIVGRGRLVAATALCALLVGLSPKAARAQLGSDRYSSIVVDAGTGSVLEDYAADEPRHPASLTKMMTLYMTFEALRDRRIGFDEPVPVSAHAASMVPTKLGLVPGTTITVEQAILGLVTMSANDAAAALGELMGGDEDRFAQMMTLRARALGMSHTVFRNASGLPDPGQVTTARDLAVLARHLVQDFPSEYHFFSTPYFVFHGRTIMNHDTMLRTYPGADGLKTGYIADSGHNLATSAVRDGVRLIGIVLGAASNGQRDLYMTALLNHGFDSEGVAPVMVARAEHGLHLRLPSLIASAHAATLPVSLRPSLRPTIRWASATRPVAHEPHHAAEGWAARAVTRHTRVAARATRAHDAGAETSCAPHHKTACAGRDRHKVASR